MCWRHDDERVDAYGRRTAEHVAFNCREWTRYVSSSDCVQGWTAVEIAPLSNFDERRFVSVSLIAGTRLRDATAALTGDPIPRTSHLHVFSERRHGQARSTARRPSHRTPTTHHDRRDDRLSVNRLRRVIERDIKRRTLCHARIARWLAVKPLIISSPRSLQSTHLTRS